MTIAVDRAVPPRPYSRIRGKRERSVTEIIATKAIPNLPWGAAGETALYAVHHRDEWIDLDPAEAVEKLRSHHQGVWNAKAAMGTATHAVMEAWIAGETVDLAALVYRMADERYEARGWRGREDATVEQLSGYVDGLERFWLDWQPAEVHSEECVRTPGVYIGQRDVVATLRTGRRALLDIKTTAQQTTIPGGGVKGVYGDSWSLQLAAYDRALEIVTYGWGVEGRLTETGTRPNERVDVCGVIHLRGDHLYTLYELRADDAAFQAFLNLAAVNHWLRALKPPVAIPATTSQETP